MNDTISQKQYISLLISSFIGIGILSLSSDLCRISKEDAWISSLLGGVHPLVILLCSYYIYKNANGQCFYQCLKDIYGKIIGIFFYIIFLLNYFLIESILINAYTEILKLSIANYTPIFITWCVIIFATSMTSYSGLKSLGRLSELTLPFIIPLLFIPYIYLWRGSYTNVLPIGNMGLSIFYAVPKAFLAYQGSENSYFLISSLKDEKDLWKDHLKSMSKVILIYSSMVFTTIFYLGHELTCKIRYSLLFLIELIEIPILSDLRSIFLIAWSSAIILTISINQYIFIDGIKNIRNIKKINIYIFNTLAILSMNLVYTYNKKVLDFIEKVIFPGLYIFIFFISIFSVLILYIKKKEKKMKKLKPLLILATIFTLFINFYNMMPVERLAIVVGIGNDISKDKSTKYSSTFEVLSFIGSSTNTSIELSGYGDTLYTAQNERQMKNSRKWVFFETVYLTSEERARDGIKDLLDTFVRDDTRNERSFAVVTKEDTKKVFSTPTVSNYSISEQIYGILKNINNAHFFSNKFELIDVMMMASQEGREIVLPYLEIEDKKPKITGLALFKGDKMVKRVDLQESMLINILKNKNSKGYISLLSENSQDYIDFYGKSSSKVKVSNQDKKLKYDIYVNMKGSLTVNTLKDENLNFDKTNFIEEEFEKQLKEELTKEVSKIQKGYELDCLGLTKYALAKYGRNSEYTNEDSFLNSIIDVHVNVKLKSSGRSSSKSQED